MVLTQGISRLIDLNGKVFRGITDYPKMVHSDIKDRNMIELPDFLKKYRGNRPASAGGSAGRLYPDRRASARAT